MGANVIWIDGVAWYCRDCSQLAAQLPLLHLSHLFAALIFVRRISVSVYWRIYWSEVSGLFPSLTAVCVCVNKSLWSLSAVQQVQAFKCGFLLTKHSGNQGVIHHTVLSFPEGKDWNNFYGVFVDGLQKSVCGMSLLWVFLLHVLVAQLRTACAQLWSDQDQQTKLHPAVYLGRNGEAWLVPDLERYFSPPNYLLCHTVPSRNKCCQVWEMRGGYIQMSEETDCGRLCAGCVSAADELPWQIRTAQLCVQISCWWGKVKKCSSRAFVSFILNVIVLAPQQMSWVAVYRWAQVFTAVNFILSFSCSFTVGTLSCSTGGWFVFPHFYKLYGVAVRFDELPPLWNFFPVSLSQRVAFEAHRTFSSEGTWELPWPISVSK